MLELPALTTRMVSATAQARIGCFAIWLWRSRAATAQEAMRVRTWSAREVKMIGMREEGQVLGQHVAGLEIGYHKDLRLTGDLRFDALDACRLGADRVVESKRTIEIAAGDLAAIRHLAQRRRFCGGGDGWGYRLDGGEDGDLGNPEAKPGVKIDGVLDDVALGHEVWRDVHRGIGDKQGLRMAGNVHHDDMAAAASGP